MSAAALESLLTGRRCAECDTVAFGSEGTCPSCSAVGSETLELSREGVVWTLTIQRFAPKSPPYVPATTEFQPFAIVYVELREGIRVEGVLKGPDPAAVKIGDRVRLVRAWPVPEFAPMGEPS